MSAKVLPSPKRSARFKQSPLNKGSRCDIDQDNDVPTFGVHLKSNEGNGCNG